MTRPWSISAVLAIFFVIVSASVTRQGAAQEEPAYARAVNPYVVHEGSNIDKVDMTTGALSLDIPLLSFPQRGPDLTLDFNIRYTAPQWFQSIAGVQWESSQNGSGDLCGGTISFGGKWLFQNNDMATVLPLGVSVVHTQFLTQSFDRAFNTIYYSNFPQGNVGTFTSASNGWGADNLGATTNSDEPAPYGPDPPTYCTHTPANIENDVYYVADAEGAKHYFAADSSGTSQRFSLTETEDGSGIAIPSGSFGSWNTFIDRKGTHYVETATNTNPNVLSSATTDRFGNTISNGKVTGGQSGWTDTVGRFLPNQGNATETSPGVVTTDLSHCQSGTTAAAIWTVPGPSTDGGQEEYYLCYSPVPYHTNFNVGQYSAVGGQETFQSFEGAGSTPLLTEIVLPNNTNYLFTYDSYLCLSSIKLPSGGTISYTYKNIWLYTASVSGGANQYMPVISRVVATRSVDSLNGTGPQKWTYGWASAPAPAPTTASANIFTGSSAVTDPVGNAVVHSVVPNAGRDNEQTYLQGVSLDASGFPSGGTTLKTVTVAYTQTGSGIFLSMLGSNAAVHSAPHTTTETFAGGSTRQHTISYVPGTGSATFYNLTSSLGWVKDGRYLNSLSPVSCACFLTEQPQSETYSDYGTNGSPGAVLKTITYQYRWQNAAAYQNANLIDLLDSVVLGDSSGKPAQTTAYAYDETQPASSGLTPSQQLNPAPGSVLGQQTSECRFITPTTSPSCPATANSSYIRTGQLYYDSGEINQFTDGRGYTTTDTYGQCEGSLLSKQVNALNQSSSWSYDCGIGKKTLFTDANNQSTTFSYADHLGRLKEIGYADGGSTQFNYNGDPSPPLTTIARAIGSAQSPIDTQIDYDGLGRTTGLDLLSDPYGTVLIKTSYDAAGRIHSVSNPYRSTSDPTYGATYYSYDALDRKTSQTQPDGTSTQHWSYSGNSTVFTDENESQWQQTSDGLGRLSMVLEPTATSTTPTMETDYTYDALNNLINVDQYGGPKNEANGSSIDRARSFSYDSLSRLTSATNSPESGTTTPGSGTTSYTYDANGNVSKKTDARGVAISYVYDALDRLTKKSYSDGTASALFGYDGDDASGKPLKNSSNAVGRLSQLSEGLDGSIIDVNDISYDGMGRIANKNECIPGDCSYGINVTATYDLAGNLSTLTNGSKAHPITFTYTYDGAERLGTITSSLKSGAYPPTLFNATSTNPVSYAAAGMLQHATLGTAMLTLNQSYDTRERLIYESVANSKTTLYSACMPDGTANTHCTGSAGYQPNGNLANVTDSVIGRWNYTYDDLNRLSTAAAYNGPYNSQYGCWSYDAFGNRTLEAVSTTKCIGSLTPTYWAKYANLSTRQNQVTGTGLAPNGYTYDTAGNVQNDGVNNYLYDGEGRVCAVQSLTPGVPMEQYIYDPAGSRVGKGTIGTFNCDKTKNGFSDTAGYVLGIDGEQLTEINGSNIWQHTNAFANGKLLATYSGTNTYFAINDWLGTKRVIAGVDGCVSNYVSLPFGDSLQPSAATGFSPCSDASEHHYTGKERDTESGLDYFGARYYASNMGRWMSPDWADKPEAVPYSQLDNPQSLNLYGYVNNNPLSKADKDGHCPDACVVEGLTAGTVVAIATVGAAAVYLSTPSGQRTASTFTSAFSSSVSSSVSSIKNFFSSSKSDTPAPAAPVGATPVPTTAPATPGTQTAQPTSNPWTGQPGSQSQTAQPDGSPKQVRRYGPDGHPETDVDHGHDHGQGDPHAHDIGRPADGSPPTHVDRGPGRPVQPNDPKPQ